MWLYRLFIQISIHMNTFNVLNTPKLHIIVIVLKNLNVYCEY